MVGRRTRRSARAQEEEEEVELEGVVPSTEEEEAAELQDASHREGYRLEWVELTNFKSYAGTHRLGPFNEGVNAVIGPNGSGKSNVMDAIAFVLGSKSKDLRCASSFKDLVHTPKASENEGEEEARGSGTSAEAPEAEAGARKRRRKRRKEGEEEENDGTEAVVSALLVSIPLVAGGEERRLEIQRSCSTRGTCEYRLGGRRVTWDTYRSELQRAGVLCNSSIKSYTLEDQEAAKEAESTDTPHLQEDDEPPPPLCGSSLLCVFQGEVDGLAARTPKELCTLFEHSSGSILLKDAYNELVEKKRQADEKTSLAYSKKRGIAAEKRDMKSQKDEADRYVEKEKRLKELQVELVLARLHLLTEEANTKRSEKEELNSDLAVLIEECDSLEQELNEARTNSAKVRRMNAKVESNLAKVKKLPASKKGSLKHVEGEIHQIIKRLRSNEVKVKKLKAEEKKRNEEEKELAELEKEKEEELNKVLGALSGGKGASNVVINENDEEYNTLKAEVGKDSAILQQEKDALRRQIAAEADTLLAVETEARELNQTLQQLEVESEELEVGLKEKRSEEETLEQKLKAKQQKQKQSLTLHKKHSARRDQLQMKLGELEGQMREAKSYRKQRERDAKMFAAIVSLKEQPSYGGRVYGRLSELCKIAESKKYMLAITVALGKHMDAVVVEDTNTAKECIQWLKNKFLPPMTFLPLRNLKVSTKPLINLGGAASSSPSAKLAYDIIQFDQKFERVVRFVCGNTIVCESHSEAKALAYNGRSRHKVVTVDGTLFDKAGTITGGRGSQGMERLMQRWEEGHMMEVKQSYSRLEKELVQLPPLSRMIAEEQENEKEIETMTEALKEVKTVLKTREEKKAGVLEAIKTVKEKKKQKILPVLHEKRKSVEELRKEEEKVEKKMNEVADRIFSKFSKKIGVSNIREYEEGRMREEKERQEMKMELNLELSKIRSQLEYARGVKDTGENLEKKEKEIEKDRTRIEKLKAKEKSLIEETKVLEGKRLELEKQGEELRKEVEKWEGVREEKKKSFMEKDKEKKQKETKMKVLEKDVEDLEEKMREVEKENSKLDLKNVGRQDEELIKEEIQSVQTELEQMQPNLKAPSLLEGLVEQEKELADDLAVARKDGEEIETKLSSLRNKRNESFVSFVQNLQPKLQEVYKELTGGGQAYLSLEDPNGVSGVRFTCLPPSKRFRDMSDLSGGEKTMAALALVFATSAASFFVLDEIDAALDRVNVRRLISFLQKRRFQSITISLKDTFYQGADLLTGVCRDPNTGFSKSLTLDLTQFA